MINGEKVLGVITARSGSRGIPGKNIRIVGGKALIAWTIEAGKASRYLDRLILSSDDQAIIDVARTYDCEVPFTRDARLARDETSSIEVVRDAIDRCPGYDWVVLLQPTSPLRTSVDIDRALEICAETGASACASVCEAKESPYWMYRFEKGSRLEPLMPNVAATRRQDLPKAYSLNGAVYVGRVSFVLAQSSMVGIGTAGYVMPVERSCDIDEEQDMARVEEALARRVGAQQHCRHS